MSANLPHNILRIIWDNVLKCLKKNKPKCKGNFVFTKKKEIVIIAIIK